MYTNIVYCKSANHIWCTVLDLKWWQVPPFIHVQTLRFLLSPRMKSSELAANLQKSTPVSRCFLKRFWIIQVIAGPFVVLCAFWGKQRNHKTPHYFLQVKSSIAGQVESFPQVVGEYLPPFTML